MEWTKLKELAPVISCAIGVVGFAWGIWKDIRLRRSEKLRKQAESKLAAIARRGDAPFLVPSPTTFHMLHERINPGEVTGWIPGATNVLCYLRDAVERTLEAGDPVIFVVENHGEAARAVIVELDGQRIELLTEADMRDSKGLQFLKYPYLPAKHGVPQKLSLRF